MQLVITLIVAVVIYMVQHSIYKSIWDKNLSVDISFTESYIDVGEDSTLVEVINNDKWLPLPVFHVKFSTERSFVFKDYDNAAVTDCYHRNDAFSIMGNQRITRKLQFTATRRGVYTISGVTVTARDFFMTRSFARSVGSFDMLYVFPRKINTPEFKIFMNTVIGEMETKRGLIEDPYTFRGIREYGSYDSMNKINWKASAKTGELMVNQYGYTWEPKVKILLNLDTNIMIKTEHITELSIELASSVAKELLNNKVSVMLVSNGTEKRGDIMVPVLAGATREHLLTVDKYLATISGNTGAEGFLDIVDQEILVLDKEITYVVISSYHKEDLLMKLDYLVKEGVDIHMIVPYYDIQGMESQRRYMYGWEVKLIET